MPKLSSDTPILYKVQGTMAYNTCPTNEDSWYTEETLWDKTPCVGYIHGGKPFLKDEKPLMYGVL